MPGPDANLPFVSVVIPVRDGAATLADCIGSVLACDYPAARREVLVVDNGSTDASAEVAQRFPVTLLHESRPGVSNARNRGIAASRGEILAFIDCDCVAEPPWLAEMARPFSDPEVGCVAGELGHAAPRTAAERQAARMFGAWQRFAVSSDPPYAITANAAYRREVLEEIGSFDPRMPRAQDVDLGLRFSELSARRMVLAEGAVVRHRHRSTLAAFFRQQLGWAYGAGLVAAKYRALDGRPASPPRIGDVARSLRGLALVLGLRLRPDPALPYRRSFLEDAWFGLIRAAAWYLGARAGLWRGAARFGRARPALTARSPA